MKRVIALLSFLMFCLLLTGCLSHWFLDSTSRLQVENATEDYTLLGLDVLAKDSSAYKTWIEEVLLPGERSRVIEEDWVGDFIFRVRYTKTTDGSGAEQQFVFDTELEGGSLYLIIENDGDSLDYRFK